MRILHVCKKYPDALGGDAVVVANLQKQQQIAKHQVAILTSNCPQIITGPHIHKFGLIDQPTSLDNLNWRRLVSLMMLVWQAFRVIKRERPEVIHCHSVDLALAMSLAAHWHRLPLVQTFHIVTFYNTQQAGWRRKSELIMARLAKTQLVTAPNDYDVAQLQQAGLRQAKLMPNGVDTDFWYPAKATRRSSQPFVFVTYGRLEAQKGYSYLIKAAALLAGLIGPQFRLIIIGGGSQQAALQQLINEFKLADIVQLAGPKTATEVRQHLWQAQAAVFPSLYETTPLSLLEAWAVRLPTIITPVGIMRQRSGNDQPAYLVSPQDEQSLFQAMLKCIEDPRQLAQIASAGYQEVSKYRWPQIAQTAQAMYASVV